MPFSFGFSGDDIEESASDKDMANLSMAPSIEINSPPMEHEERARSAEVKTVKHDLKDMVSGTEDDIQGDSMFTSKNDY